MAADDGIVIIPPAFEHLMGVPDEATRVYRTEGNHSQMRRWFDGLCQHIGPCLSPGAAGIYAKVSRAAVYKRMKAGHLTAFCFKLTGNTRTLAGRARKLKALPLIYIPVEECKAWSADRDLRSDRLNMSPDKPQEESAAE